jgi:hypothetical protein
MAGDRARRLYAHEEAEMYYSRAIEIQQGRGMREEQARTFFKLGMVYTAAYQPKKAQEAYVRLRSGNRCVNLPARRGFPNSRHPACGAGRTAHLRSGLAEDDISAFMVAQLFEGLE